jgi:peptide methionine sulfoxide reductase MsrA
MDSPRGILEIDDILGKGCFTCEEIIAPQTHGVLKILAGGYTLGRLQEVLSLE